MDQLPNFLSVLLGGVLALAGSVIVESLRAKRDREAWERTHEADRVAKRSDNQRDTVEELQDVVYRFHLELVRAASQGVQLTGAKIPQERYERLSELSSRGIVLLNRVARDDIRTDLDDYLGEQWYIMLARTPHEVLEGARASLARWEKISEDLRAYWISL